MSNKRPGRIYRFFHRIYRIRPVTWFISIVVPPIDKFLFKISRKKFTLVKILSGLEVYMVNYIGHKSGIARKVPLVGIIEEDNIYFIASNWGRKKHPGWYYGLKNAYNAEIVKNNKKHVYSIKEIQGEEYERIWSHGAELYSGYNSYKKRAKRKIPILKMEPIMSR